MGKYKRQYRELDDLTKKKISDGNKGKKLSEYQKALISQSMIDYWKSVPHRPNNESQTLNDEEK